MQYGPVLRQTSRGLTIELKSAAEEDAQVNLDFYRKAAGETRFLLSDPEDLTITLEIEKEFMRDYEASADSLLLNAYAGGEFAGNGSFRPAGKYPRVKHRAILAIALAQKFRRQGIGELLMRTLIENARSCGYEIAELGVLSLNIPAQHLYAKLGFTECGRIRNAFKYKDGTYDDEIMMQLFLQKGRP